jgi:hypothetical protein|eukprot:COSAG01_NODE_1354_length_10598_cov_6.459758_2_plen_85_part_00
MDNAAVSRPAQTARRAVQVQRAANNCNGRHADCSIRCQRQESEFVPELRPYNYATMADQHRQSTETSGLAYGEQSQHLQQREAT